jgi:hypothetical protein
MDILAQIFGIIAMICFILSFQFKKGTLIIFAQLIGSVFYSMQYALLSAINNTVYMGLLMNVIGIFRALVYYKRDFFHAEHVGWLIFFITTFVACYVLLFTTFGMKATVTNIILEALPVLGKSLTTVGFKLKNARIIRIFALINSIPWGIYHLTHMSIGGTIGETISFISSCVGIVRHDIKKKNAVDTTKQN